MSAHLSSWNARSAASVQVSASFLCKAVNGVATTPYDAMNLR